VLDVQNLCSGYGDVEVLRDLSFTVENEIFAVLGANGAGKSTLLKENLSLGAMVGERSKEERLHEVFDLFPRLADRKSQSAGSLSGGEGQMLAVGRALMQDPKIILLDEPSAGLSPLFVDILFEKIADTRTNRGVAIVLAEQNAVKTMEIADRVLVLSLGEMHLLKDAKELDRKELMEAYHI